jgi:hypothetical protein
MVAPPLPLHPLVSPPSLLCRTTACQQLYDAGVVLSTAAFAMMLELATLIRMERVKKFYWMRLVIKGWLIYRISRTHLINVD